MKYSYKGIINDMYDINGLRDRLLTLIANDPAGIYKISADVGLSHTTFLDFVNNRRVPRRCSMLKIKDYVEKRDKSNQ